MPADADKVRMIDGEIAALQALLVGDGEFEGLQAKKEALVRRRSQRSAKHKATIHTRPGWNRLDHWKNEAERVDSKSVDVLILQCAEHMRRGDMLPPKNLYSKETLKRLVELAKSGLALSASIVSSSDVKMVSANPAQIGVSGKFGDFYPAIAYVRPEALESVDKLQGAPDSVEKALEGPAKVDTVKGFEFLSFGLTEQHLTEWEFYSNKHIERPSYNDAEGTYHTLYSFTTFALLMNCMTNGLKKFPVSNIHVICKGFKEFNEDGYLKLAMAPSGEREALIWYVDTDDIRNLTFFVKSVLESVVFLQAVAAGAAGTQLRRVVVWIMLKGHMEAFCWDTLFDNEGECVKDILYIMTTIEQRKFDLDNEIHDHIITEFKDQMLAAGYITQDAVSIPELKCRAELRASMIKNTPDVACVGFTAFATFFLLHVLDIEDWDGRQIDKRFWEYCRAGYASFERGMMSMLKTYIRKKKAIWICPGLEAHHVNINDVYLMAVSRTGEVEKLTYDWEDGWCTDPMESISLK
jgi:hypothetical protein